MGTDSLLWCCIEMLCMSMACTSQWNCCVPGKPGQTCQFHMWPACKSDKQQAEVVSSRANTQKTQVQATNCLLILWAYVVHRIPPSKLCYAGIVTSMVEHSSSYIVITLDGSTYRFSRLHLKPSSQLHTVMRMFAQTKPVSTQLEPHNACMMTIGKCLHIIGESLRCSNRHQNPCVTGSVVF